LADALFARTRTSFGIGQIVYFSFINRHVSVKETLLTRFMLSQLVVYKRRNLFKAFKFSK